MPSKQDSYVVFARKYRPNTFDEIIGQEHVATTLKNAIKSNRLAHAYLFTGPRGVGKTTTARILAKALNCKTGPTETPCNSCPSCLEITQSVNPDVLEIDGASNRGINEVRDLREKVRYAPVQGRYKIYIIDEVHMLTTEASNALLKTLEEPPSHVIFIFATTEPNKLLPTILSRCQRFDFRKISAREIMDRLKSIADLENIKIEEDAGLLIAKKADGSVRDAESMLDQVASFSQGKVTVPDVRTVLGFVPSELLFELTDDFSSHDAKAALLLIDRVVQEGHDPSEFLLELVEHLRTLLLMKMDVRLAELQGLPESEIHLYRDQAAKFDSGQILRMLSLTSQLEPRLHRSTQPRTLLDTHVVQLSQLDSTVMLETLLGKIEGMKERKAPPPKPAAGNGNLSETFTSLIGRLKEQKRFLAEALSSGTPESLDDKELKVAFTAKNKFQMESVQTPANSRLIETELAGLLGTRIKLTCTLLKEEPAPKPTAKKPKKPAEEDETVKQIMETFDAEIVDSEEPAG
jgi:DNA polymerase-3 subunit gamma/tau